MTNEDALVALTRALELAEPQLRFTTTSENDEYVTHVSYTGPKGTSRMKLTSSYYKDAVLDPEHLESYVERIVANLKKEVGL